MTLEEAENRLLKIYGYGDVQHNEGDCEAIDTILEALRKSVSLQKIENIFFIHFERNELNFQDINEELGDILQEIRRTAGQE